MRRRTKWFVLAAVACVGVAGSVSVAWAAIGDGGVITTCYGKGKGTWRPISTVNPAETCKRGEQKLEMYSKSGADAAFLNQGEGDAAYLGKTEKAVDSDKLDGIDSSGFVQGTGKTYVGRVVVPTSNPLPNDTVLAIPGFATLRALNCQAGGANAALVNFDQARGTFSGWRSTGADNPDYASSPGLISWGSNFQPTERTTWLLSVGTGANSEAALIDLHTQVSGSNCIYSAVAQVWGR